MSAKKKLDTTILNNVSTGDLIDEIGNLQAAVRDLKAREDLLAAAIKERIGTDEVSGARFTAKQTEYTSSRLDTDKAKAFLELNVDPEHMSEFYAETKTHRLTVKVAPVWAQAAE